MCLDHWRWQSQNPLGYHVGVVDLVIIAPTNSALAHRQGRYERTPWRQLKINYRWYLPCEWMLFDSRGVARVGFWDVA